MLFRTLATLLFAAAATNAIGAWTPIPTGTSAQLNDINTLQSWGAGAFLIAGNGGVFLRTVDTGANWTQPLVGASADLHRIRNMSSAEYYVSGTAGKVYLATSAALTWGDVSPLSAARLIVFGRSSGVPQLIGSDGSYRRDEDFSIGGVNWTGYSTGTTKSLNDAIGFYSSNVYAVGDSGTIVFAADGLSFVPQTSGTIEDLHDIVDVGFAKLIFGSNGTILRSTDDQNWTSIASGTSQHLYEAAGSAASGNLVMAVGANGTILYSADAGLTWCPQASGTTNDLRGVLAQGGTFRWYAVGDNGTLIWNNDNVDCVDPVGVESFPRVQGFNLAVAPNPFNPRTTISFEAPRAGHVSLRVYGARGQLLRVLLDREVEAGLLKVSWDGRDDSGRRVSSGVYYVELRGLGSSQRAKVALIE